ncbi:MAG: valine--tRNA ligase [Oscillospiraceae bacterium]|jgi:valyl-tRNA synthetase|nr:valine--tRNA ligase [Oscillospiraceae bacterium]
MSNLSKQYAPQEIEDKWYYFWESRFFSPPAVGDAERKTYVIVMPPPNITGRLHMGHALDNTLQDVIIRFKRMQGFDALWVPGTDHASIATEAKIVAQMKEEGLTKQGVGREGFLERAFAWKADCGAQITQQIRKLGCSCDWSRERFTMDEGCSEAVTRVFVNLAERGLIYRAERIVNWCPYCKTSISDIEVGYAEENGSLCYVAYAVEGGGQIVVATTRPETIMGDTAIAVNPADERYKLLIGRTAVLPVGNRTVPIVADDYVSMDFGTGALKVTPAHDPNDFELGVRHRLPVINVMTTDGRINENGGKYAGLTIADAREAILRDLELSGSLIEKKSLKHNVGKCYRCGTIVEPMVMLQWFVRMQELARPAIDVVKNKTINFIPERFEKVYFNWLENIKDWCVSRQLWWGHRIPAYYCTECSHVEIASRWPQSCSSCGCERFAQDEDTLDTWFSSALWPFSALGWPQEAGDFKRFYPTQTLVTGYDIIFFWVARMVFAGLDQTFKPPFQNVYIHGLVRDAQGRKMSKSLGNGIDPIEVIEKHGADVLRMVLVLGVSPGNDLRFSEEKILLARNFANKIWNAVRFILVNLPGSSVLGAALVVSDLKTEDRWVVGKLNRLVCEVTENLESFEFGIALQKLYDFTWDVFCDWYIELAKIRIKAQESQVFDVLIVVAKEVLKLLHPFLPFITEELWQALPHDGESIMIQPWCQPLPGFEFAEEIGCFEKLIAAVKAIRNARAVAKIPQNKKLLVYVLTNEAIIKDHPEIIKKLGGAETVKFCTEEDQPVDMFTAHTDAARIFIELAEKIDKEKEYEKLSLSLSKHKKELEVLEKRLEHKEIWEKAPATAQKYKEEMENLCKRVCNIEASLRQLAPS